MKTHLLNFVGLTALALASVSAALAQQTVSTGSVKSLSPKDGTVTIRSDQTHGDLTLYGLKQANIFTADGKSLQVSDLEQGQMVTITYAIRDQHWYVSQVILSEPRPAVVSRNTTPEDIQRIRQATEGATRTPSASDKPEVTAQPAAAPQSGTSISVPLVRKAP